MSKKTWIIIVLIIIILGVVVGIQIQKNENHEFSFNNTTGNIINEVANEVETKNTIEDKMIENTTMENNVEDKTQVKETFTESPKSDGEKAIQIVKNNYGEGPNTEFEIANWDDGKGRIVVVVTDTNTTRNVFYHVNVNSGDFEIQY